MMDALHKVACRGSSATSIDGDRLKAEAIAAAFAWCFYREFNTELVGGAPEPLYRPGSTTGPAQLMYREDFPASALHEAAHWCIAGKARRQQRTLVITTLQARARQLNKLLFLPLSCELNA